MNIKGGRPESAALPDAQFHTTHWSVVLAARGENLLRADDALAQLCRVYWFPLYAYIRRRGHSPHDTQDLTQEFFARLLAHKFLSAVRKERGKFRWFLLSALQRFLTNEWHHDHAAKRGGGCRVMSLDEETAENRYRVEIADYTTPETLFDRNWAVTVLEQAQRQLQEEYTNSNRGPIFEQFKVFLFCDRAPMTLAEAGAVLGMGENAMG